MTMDSNSDWEADRAIQEAELAWNSDEDLLEILTCPSPVWWEDPPDDQYSEGMSKSKRLFFQALIDMR